MGHVQAMTPHTTLELSQHAHTGRSCVVFSLPCKLNCSVLRIKLKWNHSTLVSEECDIAGHKVCCVCDRSLGAVRMRMGWESQRCLLLVGMGEGPGL